MAQWWSRHGSVIPMDIIPNRIPEILLHPAGTLPALVFLVLLVVQALIRTGRGAATACVTAVQTFLALALVAAVAVRFTGPFGIVLNPGQPVELGVYLDTISTTTWLLVSFLAAVVVRFSVNHMDGDRVQSRVSRLMLLVYLAVSGLILSSDLLCVGLCWLAASLALHGLLTVYPDRPVARMAARKKFLISRLGDLLFLGAVLGIALEFGTVDLPVVLARAAEMPGDRLWIINGLLVAAAVVKSAQFPFHTWLPDTLDVPTPVSALLHAGVVNAGGFLLIRLSPLLVRTPEILLVLAVLGGFTAVFGVVVQMTQNSIKRSLVWSTISQLGFMLMQCGFGVFSLAMIHLFAHALYKAHAFLTSGGTVWSRGLDRERQGSGTLGLVTAFLAVGCVVVAGCLMVGNGFPGAPSTAGEALILGVFLLGILQPLAALWGRRRGVLELSFGGAVLAGVLGLLLVTHWGAEAVFGPGLPAATRMVSPATGWVAGGVGVAFLLLLGLQVILRGPSPPPFLARLQVHAQNGFYLGARMRRWLGGSGANPEESRP